MKKAFLILGLVAVSAAAGGLTAWTVSADRGGSVAYIEREVERTPALGTQFTSYQAEQYPDLKANQNYIKAMDSVNSYESSVRSSRLIYNDSVTKLNRAVRMFPASIVAGMFGFKQRDYLATDSKKADMPSMK